MKTIGLTPRSLAGIIRENHPDYKIIGCDIEKKAVGFFMEGLLDEYFICPRCNTLEYFPWIEKLVKENLKAAGVKMNTIVNLDIYYQPEEGDIYYVATTKDGKELSNEEALKIEE